MVPGFVSHLSDSSHLDRFVCPVQESAGCNRFVIGGKLPAESYCQIAAELRKSKTRYRFVFAVERDQEAKLLNLIH